MITFSLARSASCDPAVTDAWLTSFALDLSTQLTRDLAPAWGLDPRGLVVDPTPYASFDVASAASYVLEFVGAMPPEDAADAAYHDEEPNGRVRAPIATLGYSLDQVSIAASHEACEAVGDPDTNAWVDTPSGGATMRELADAVQDGGYRVRQGGCLMSNFLLPSWFDPEGKAPWDYLGAAPGPFQRTAGGYMIVRSTTGVRSQDPPGARLGRRALAALRGGR